MYNPQDHYWLRRSGAVYSTAQSREISVDEATTNEQYQAWLTSGWHPTVYPCSTEVIDPGFEPVIPPDITPEELEELTEQYVPPTYAESRDELAKVLAPYGLYVYPRTETENVILASEEAQALIMPRLVKVTARTETFTPEEFNIFGKAGLYDNWEPNRNYPTAKRLLYSGIVYQTRQPVLSQAHQLPGSTGMESIYLPISREGEISDGSREHPFNFIWGMSVYPMKYYSYSDHVYQYIFETANPACYYNPGEANFWELVE